MPRKIRLSVDLRLNGSPAAVAKAVELLATAMTDLGHYFDEDWSYLPDDQGITLHTLAAFGCAVDVIADEHVPGIYMIETDREDDEDDED